MKQSSSTDSLVTLDTACFICLEEKNELGEPLVDSRLLRNCGCRFSVHPYCWNKWMLDKTDYDCPICRRESLHVSIMPHPLIPNPLLAIPPPSIRIRRDYDWMRDDPCHYQIAIVLAGCFAIALTISIPLAILLR